MSPEFNFDQASREIEACLNLDNPRSFFLFAGAGSGKTGTLVAVLKKFADNFLPRLRKNGQKVAIITYTNAACDEIKRRLDFETSFAISTIHSFSWELIRNYQRDIRRWVETSLKTDIDELGKKSSRTGSKAELERIAKIASKKKRLAALPQVQTFQYNPNGENTGRDYLMHDEVISITKDFLEKPLLQKILVQQFPILFIDESQDTKKELIDAFFAVQSANANAFTLGLFGDMMQRIYNDGKQDLGRNLPESWAKPVKSINYRCPKRIIRLINKIREDVDDQMQVPKPDSEEGIIRLFLIQSEEGLNKTAIEEAICSEMEKVCDDPKWRIPEQVKLLALEHKMLARRGGFLDFFEPLYKNSDFKTGLQNGDLSGIPFFLKQILPLFKAKQKNDSFAVASIVKKYSPLLTKEVLMSSSSPAGELSRARNAVSALYALWEKGMDPSLLEIIREVARSGLFEMTETLKIIATREESEGDVDAGEQDEKISAWERALAAPFSQLERYADYIYGESRFATHQGIKGLEFPRVMVVLDDEDSGGFMFSYEKLIGVEELSDADRRNREEGRENKIDRTLRLFYVICSRAEKALAVVAYTNNIEKAKQYVVGKGWFNEDEILPAPAVANP